MSHPPREKNANGASAAATFPDEKLKPGNSIIEEPKNEVTEDKADNGAPNLTHLLFKTIVFTSGFVLDEPTSFGKSDRL